MSNYITYEDRMEIENLLHNGKSFGAIAKSLKKDRSTISREIKKYSNCDLDTSDIWNSEKRPPLCSGYSANFPSFLVHTISRN